MDYEKRVKILTEELGYYRGLVQAYEGEDAPESKLATNREMMEWLSRGFGEWSYTGLYGIVNQWTYSKGEENRPVNHSLRVRRWDESDWSVPLGEDIREDLRKKLVGFRRVLYKTGLTCEEKKYV